MGPGLHQNFGFDTPHDAAPLAGRCDSSLDSAPIAHHPGESRRPNTAHLSLDFETANASDRENTMQDAPSKQRLELASHVRACACESCVVLLDLRRSRYLAISKPEALQLCSWIKGWPALEAQHDHEVSPSIPHATLQHLIALELLTRAGPASAAMDAHEQKLPAASADLDQATTAPRISARRVLRFLSSSAHASWCLRHQSLWAIAHASTSRRHKLLGPNTESMRAIQSACAAYAALRPFFFSTQKQCLHDSLALLSFLATEGLLARWVIGVKSGPFAAHSWLQSGETVLNDQHERVRQFRPILVV